jgi:hypothetical protein
MPIRKIARSKRKKQHYYQKVKKGRGKKMAAELLLKAITKEIEAVICRAPDFTDRKTKGLTNALIFDSLKRQEAQYF